MPSVLEIRHQLQFTVFEMINRNCAQTWENTSEIHW